MSWIHVHLLVLTGGILITTNVFQTYLKERKVHVMNSEMKTNNKQSLNHKQWRRIAKKERRKRVRCKIAQERDADEARLRATLEQDPDYLNWVKSCEKFEDERKRQEKEEHDANERLWLECEVKEQNEWKELQIRKVKARQEQLQQEELIRKEFEAKQADLKQKREELISKYEEEVKRHENIQREIDDYINNGAKTPEVLRVTSDSQPGKELCPFFSKTAACKYGDACSRNHRRSALTKIIVILGFYSHFSLEKNSAEYDTDIGLEYEQTETRRHFREFYKDVVPELESYGRIKTLKCCCNSVAHLRGNLYVEYYNERDAARAWRQLIGRWYGGKQLHCEFANFKSWRNAVCGLSKCPKGRGCNYLHTFTNYTDNYEIRSPPRWFKKAENESTSSRRSKASFEESTRSDFNDHRNWRWSESPETEQRSPQHHSEDRYKSFDENRREKSPSDYAERSSRSSRSRTRRRSPSSSYRSSRSSKKKLRRSRDFRNKKYSKSTYDIDKENGNDSKEDKRHKHSRYKSELVIKDRKKMEIYDEQLQQVENTSKSNWDTTDSEEYNSS